MSDQTTALLLEASHSNYSAFWNKQLGDIPDDTDANEDVILVINTAQDIKQERERRADERDKKIIISKQYCKNKQEDKEEDKESLPSGHFKNSKRKDDAPDQFHQQTTDEQGFILDTELREFSTAKPAAGRRAAATDVCERVSPELGDRSTGP
ncbi:MAG: hypothetical protein EZS28_039820 [Streblomastix strix]|uniref:Uncharacterized protein n=1 Tax=Streblomastix strix TaxID=222440 RepID=A0A5J4U333_9EUKA|nr:MAG: hypothetical protein EZS28_039820 [Streblomastix strix]